jgi:hypothetical protein
MFVKVHLPASAVPSSIHWQQLKLTANLNTKERRRSSSGTVTEVHPLTQLPVLERPIKKVKHPENKSAPPGCHNYTSHIYHPPIGMKWSQNSCAYDSIFSILFNIWCHDMDKWESIFTRLGNEFCILLVDQFSKYV